MQKKIDDKGYVGGSYNFERWDVSIDSYNKTNDGTYVFIGKRIRPVRSMRHTKNKINNVL